MNEMPSTGKNNNSLARLVSVLLLLGGTLMVSGCQKYEMYPLEYIPVDNEERHPIHIRKGVKELKLNLYHEGNGLTSKQEDSVRRFFVTYKQRGQGEIEVAMPAASDNESAVYNTAGTVKRIAGAYGISPAYLRIRTYRVFDEGYPLVRMSYNYAVAKGPKCNDWSSNLGENYTNLHYYDFGCAQQKNLAAMIANPRDLVKPRGSGNRPSERRDVIWDKYIKGETTVSQRSSDERGTVSEVAK